MNRIYDIVAYIGFDMWKENKRVGNMESANGGTATLELDINGDSFLSIF